MRTRLYYPGVKKNRFPFDIRNSRNIAIGTGVSIGRNCRIEVAPNVADGIHLSIGKNVRINDNVHIGALDSISIGANTGIGSRSFITDMNHGNFSSDEDFDITIPHRERKLFSKPVRIGENVWIGENVCVCPGIDIGDGCIIGAMSNVVKSIPPYSMAVGNLARVIKKYNFDTKRWERCN